MRSRPHIRAAVVFFGALVLLGVTLALAVTFRGLGSHWDGRVISRLGWLMPAVVAALMALIGWIALAHRNLDEDSPHTMIQCVTCGAKVMTGWRMCPHCGRLTDKGEC